MVEWHPLRLVQWVSPSWALLAFAYLRDPSLAQDIHLLEVRHQSELVAGASRHTFLTKTGSYHESCSPLLVCTQKYPKCITFDLLAHEETQFACTVAQGAVATIPRILQVTALGKCLGKPLDRVGGRLGSLFGSIGVGKHMKYRLIACRAFGAAVVVEFLGVPQLLFSFALQLLECAPL